MWPDSIGAVLRSLTGRSPGASFFPWTVGSLPSYWLRTGENSRSLKSLRVTREDVSLHYYYTTMVRSTFLSHGNIFLLPPLGAHCVSVSAEIMGAGTPPATLPSGSSRRNGPFGSEEAGGKRCGACFLAVDGHVE